ncbi:MAG: histidine phosphatase family protein [Planctomycetes bacterium]|nr:histidine phosphatase family protein [Planctomycetota bacterium]MCB9885039.1 histidine phosphatase family protein [Planctomycetota bacterium]
MSTLPTCSRREALATAALGWLAWPAQDPKPKPTAALRCRTVVFVRHAEKDPDDKVDPELTERGRARAEKLAAMFAAAGVTATYATAYRRTRQTLAPLASKAGVEVADYDARASVKFAAGLGAAAEPVTPQTIVVAGHSNTLPQMVEALGGQLSGLTDKGWLGEDEYDRVVIVTLCGQPDEPLRAVATVDLRLVL